MISVIIPAWINDQETLDLTVATIQSLKYLDNELIVIDNASTLGGGQLRQLADVYVRNPVNLGYCPAVNQGLKLAKGQLIAVANNDILVNPVWVDVAQEVFKEDKVGTLHFRMTEYNQPFIEGSDIAYTGKERWCTNSFWVTSRKFLDELREIEKKLEPYPGLVDETYGRGMYDDWDFAWRIFIAGYKRVYTNKTSYKHMITHSFNKLPSEQRQLESANNLNYFIKKWGEEPDKLFARTWPAQWAMDYWTNF